MAGSGPTTALAAATAFSQVSLTGIGDPNWSVPAEVGALLSHTTSGTTAVFGEGDGALLDGGAGVADVLAEGAAETDGTGVAHPAATTRSTASAPLARTRAPVRPFIAFTFWLAGSRSVAPESVAQEMTCSDAAAFRDAPPALFDHDFGNQGFDVVPR